MQKQITLHNYTLDYTLRRNRRARHLKLAVYPNGSFVVTAPLRLNQNVIERFITQKAEWIVQAIARFKNTPPSVLMHGTKKDFVRLKADALKLVNERVAFYNAIYNFEYHHVTVRDQKTRWGSCSKKDNLNFNYKIVLLPPHVADYIIVHELCHLKEFNHSRNFWALVEKTIPDYRECRRALRFPPPVSGGG